MHISLNEVSYQNQLAIGVAHKLYIHIQALKLNVINMGQTPIFTTPTDAFCNLT